MTRDELDRALITAHERNDAEALVGLYTTAADLAEDQEDIEAACFYLTHAFVFGLESGDPRTPTLNQRLVARGRAKLLEF